MHTPIKAHLNFLGGGGQGPNIDTKLGKVNLQILVNLFVPIDFVDFGGHPSSKTKKSIQSLWDK